MPKPSSNAPAASAAPPPSALERAALVAADRLLYLVHLSAMVFIVFGWMPPATRMANFYLIVLTFVSWFGLGLVFGFGFCLITGIQSKIRQRLGYSEPMDSFVKHVLDRLTGRDLNPLHVEIGTQAGFYISALASAWVNFGHRWL